MPESPYTFRQRLAEVHHPNRRDPEAVLAAGEVVVDSAWTVAFEHGASDLVRRAAVDLADYLRVSMAETVLVRDLGADESAGERTIALSVDPTVEATERGYRLRVDSDRISLAGVDDRGAAQAAYYVEDLMNLRGGPYLAVGETTRSALFSRWTHSGWDLDEFPDDYLAQVAHAGIDAILVFVVAPNHTPDGLVNRHPEKGSRGRFQDLAYLTDRAARFGLDVYLYSYVHDDLPHPDDEGSQAAYDRVYGSLFEACPKAKGIVLVGESVEFRSRDPKTSGRLRLDPPDPSGLPSALPTPGWWPCTDYPQWVERVRDACRKHNPDADIVFWTYNWGWAPEPERVALIENLPDDVRLHVTFEMFEPFTHDGVWSLCVDYTASQVGPGRYFASEAAAAHKRGMALSAQANTGGLTWDFGTIPYQPIPYQWLARHRSLKRARDDWGLSGLMENHHYGWTPSFIADLAKWSYWSPSPEGEDVIAALARRDFGPGAEKALEAWDLWSRAATEYVPSNADQYGPCRIGPAYPIGLFGAPKIKGDPEPMFGELIVHAPYHPDLGRPGVKTAAAARVVGEIAAFERMQALWTEGTDRLAEAAALAPERLRANAERMVVMGRYVSTVIATTLTCKKWWQLESRLAIETDPARANELLDQLEVVARAEQANAESAIPLLEADSRLGWEPSMGYLGDVRHVTWKLAHLNHTLTHQLPTFRESLTITPS